MLTTDTVAVLDLLRRDSAATGRPTDRPPVRPIDPPETPTLDRLVGGRLPDALRQRRSQRFFGERSVPADALDRIVRAATEMDRTLWPDEAAVRPLDVLLVQVAVDGHPPSLSRVRDGVADPGVPLAHPAAVAGMVLQPEFASAAALLVVVGSLEAMLAAHGSHGHRLLLERSGAACAAAWLQVVDCGLVGSIFAGFLPSALRDLAGIDGFRQTQLLALAVGHPPSAAP